MGTVLRAEPHGTRAAGFTASLVAVRRDFLPPKRISGVALIPEAVTMLASRSHRLQHAVWHTVRVQWHRLNARPSGSREIERRGWWPATAPVPAPTGRWTSRTAPARTSCSCTAR